MRSRSLEVPRRSSSEFRHTQPFIIGQTGIIYQILNKVGSGSYGIVYNVKIIRDENGEQPNQELQEPPLVVKIIDTTDGYFEQEEYENELQCLKDIKNSDHSCFS